MADAGDLIVLTGLTALINATYEAQHKQPVSRSLVASCIGFVCLSILGGLWRWDIAMVIAGLFFFAAIVMRGLPIIEDLGAVSTPAKAGFTSGGGGTF